MLPEGVHAEPSWRRVPRPTPQGWTRCHADVLGLERVSYRLPEIWVRYSAEPVEWRREEGAWVEVGRTADGRVMGVRVVGVDRG
jgi:hypothetical protein